MTKVIQLIQQKIGVKPDGSFGPMTAKAFARHYSLITVEAAHLLGQCHLESAGFSVMEENLNYAADRLLSIFPKYFTTAAQKLIDEKSGKTNLKFLASYYERKPQAIANIVYADRMGNGPISSGDGWNHRGLGPLQLTGKDNQSRFLSSVGRSLSDSHLIATELAFDSAIWFFRTNRIFELCKDVTPATILKVSRAINVGNPNSLLMPHHLDERTRWTMYYFNLLSK